MRKYLHATLLTVITLAIATSVEWALNSSFMRFMFPESQALAQFEFTDMAFLARDQSTNFGPCHDITIVNIGVLTREGIAKQIEIINKNQPKVVGVDVLFTNPAADSGTVHLRRALVKAPNLVMACRLLPTSDFTILDSLEQSLPVLPSSTTQGFVDLVITGDETITINRDFEPTHNIKNLKLSSFAVEVVKRYRPSAAQQCLSRDNAIEAVNFKRNINSGYNRLRQNSFNVIEWNELLEERFDPGLIQNKIVLVGYTGRDITDDSPSGKFYTPLNQVPIGRSLPDMFGVVVQANIIDMILTQDFVTDLSGGIEYIIAFLATFLHLLCLLSIHQKMPRFFDLLSVVLILAQILFYALLRMYLFHWFSIKAEIEMTVGSLAVAGLSINIYFLFIGNKIDRWYNSKYARTNVALNDLA